MSTPAPASGFKAGWYDADDPGTQRYWDGQAWTDSYQRKGLAAKDGGEMVGLIVVSYLLAVFMPLIGFILGIVVVTRPAKATSRHGAWIIVLSIVAFLVWVAILASHANTATTTTY
jgi:uncharacterized membrane protein YhaH (DUF805 family)